MAGAAAARERLCALRQDIARIEGRLAETLEPPSDDLPVLRRSAATERAGILTTGAARLDAALGGGLPGAGLIEVHARETRDAGAVAGFALGLLARRGVARPGAPFLWIGTVEIMREAGLPYAPGLAPLFGIDSSALLLAPVAQLADALWIAEEAAGQPGLAAVVLELRGNPARLDLVATRRLHVRARASGLPFLLLRQGAAATPTAATVRLVVAPAPAGVRHTLAAPLPRSIGPPGIIVSIDRSRAAKPVSATLEWNCHERRFLDRDDARLDLAVPEPAAAPRQAHSGAVVTLSGDRADHAPALWPDMAVAAKSRR